MNSRHLTIAAITGALLATTFAAPASASVLDPYPWQVTESAERVLAEQVDSEPVIVGDPAVKLSFATPHVSSKPNPETNLKIALQSASIIPIGLLGAPLAHLVPTSPFSYRVSPITGEVNEFHTGQDFGSPCGTDVHAAAAGAVVFAGWHPGGGGWRVEVDHGNGLKTTYNHLSGFTVSVGQHVGRGQSISNVGTTGSSTGCHLHFEVWRNGQLTDPLPWL